MKHLRITSLILVIGMMFCLIACGGKDSKITLNASGEACWEAVDNAVEYEIQLLDSDKNVVDTGFMEETSFEVPVGYSIRVRAVFEDGKTGEWMSSDVRKNYVEKGFDVTWEDLKTYEIIANIKSGSIKTLDDGSTYFETTGPDGTMRFVGTGVVVGDGGITFEPNGKIIALDSIGSIYAVNFDVTDCGSESNWLEVSGGYTFTDAVKVDSPDELFIAGGLSTLASESQGGGFSPVRCAEFQPNFIVAGAYEANESPLTASEITVYYDSKVKNTKLRTMGLYTEFYGVYLEGEYYDSSKEAYDLEENILNFYLLAIPDVAHENEKFAPDFLVDNAVERSVWGIEDSRYTIGELKNASGKVLDKEKDALTVGCTIEVSIGKYTVDVELPIIERWKNVQTLHELTPYNNAVSAGEVKSLVVPVYWQDQPETASNKTLDSIYAHIGRVVDSEGNVKDYSDNIKKQFSLSEYFDTASYGKYSVTSFVTDWYAAPYNYEGDKEYADVSSDEEFMDGLYEWVMNTYPDMDWSEFDSDGDGFFDSVLIINAGTSDSMEMYMNSYSYAIFLSAGYTGENAGTQDKPTVKNFVSVNTSFLGSNALIHEYSHSFGLIDYYDVTYMGIDAVGGYDMQSNSVGDWNAYSKYAVGWIEPTVVSGLESGESTQITIGSFAETGDAIVIPAAESEHDGPFGEYILIDLFTDGGVNKYDAADYGLSGKYGVRITHVSSDMEKRVLTGDDGVEYPIGTVHYANDYSDDGKYLIEVIQAGGKNTFTNVDNARVQLSSGDLFKKGDVFDVAEYTEFFNDGLMDDGSDFGYTVEIVSVSEDSAVISITRK